MDYRRIGRRNGNVEIRPIIRRENNNREPRVNIFRLMAVLAILLKEGEAFECNKIGENVEYIVIHVEILSCMIFLNIIIYLLYKIWRKVNVDINVNKRKKVTVIKEFKPKKARFDEECKEKRKIRDLNLEGEIAFYNRIKRMIKRHKLLAFKYYTVANS